MRPRIPFVKGAHYGSWTVLAEAMPDPDTKARRWQVECACGAKCVRVASRLVTGKTKRCGGCQRRAMEAQSRRRSGQRGGRTAAASATRTEPTDRFRAEVGDIFGVWCFRYETTPEPFTGTRRGVFACVEGGHEKTKPLALVLRGHGPATCRDCMTAKAHVEATARRAARRAARSAPPPAPAPLPHGHMLRGGGPRLETCVSYTACLTAAAHEAPSGAHCPRGCAHFVAADRVAELIRLATSRRDLEGSRQYAGAA